jgi:hypothetical protein
MRSPIACLLLVITAAVAGCGSGEKSSSSPADAVRVYHAAIADGDAGKACDQLSDQAQKQLRDSTQGAARGSCEQVIELVVAFYDRTTKEALRKAKVTVKEKGDSATASFQAPVGLGGPPQTQTYELSRQGGEWKINQLGLIGD